MYRAALRSASRPAAGCLRTSVVRMAPRRFASTAPVDKSRSWKSSAVRWGLAVAGVYYYNTSSVFADEVEAHTLPVPAPYTDNDLPTVDALIEQKRKEVSPKTVEQAATKTEATKADDKSEGPAQSAVGFGGSADALEEEASQEGAFNPETGEINWDCPCLGGMAHGPCGEEFKTAFSCFVYSTEEPKGMDCIDKFQGMQECFRKYPEIYGSELEDADAAEAEADEAVVAAAPALAAAPAEAVAPSEIIEEERQQLRDDSPAKSRHSDGAETDNLPGVKLVAQKVTDDAATGKKEEK
ncbi:mitochondrial intermembrane space import and assembly 40 [Trichoderma arundinaceum]|uniref:Mitochondrial intermembrane space import and assembly protein 40 n=1 Tax=Trichoderma arundinaceum TaxID=490622 RepID=A0A395P141_TRIAR|nr:mitochondrial intermembrane space import and assembly 40 [Trichoderma arundinaceum]